MPANDKPLALLMFNAVAGLRRALEAHCRVVVWREVEDREAFLSGEGREVKVLITAGGVPTKNALLERLPDLAMIGYFSAGYEGIDLGYARGRGIALTYTPSTNHEDVADLAIGLAIGAVRRLQEGDRLIRSGGWTRPLPLPMAPSMRTLRFGIVGLGSIGKAVAERLEPFGGGIAWWGPRPKPGAPWPKADTLLDLARDSDVLILALKGDDTTRGLVGAEVIEALGPRGYLVNVSRGFVVDEAALADALREGRLAGAGLDVFEREPTDAERWRDLPTAALSPHLGGWARESIEGSERLVVENVRRHLAGEPLLTPIP